MDVDGGQFEHLFCRILSSICSMNKEITILRKSFFCIPKKMENVFMGVILMRRLVNKSDYIFVIVY